MHIDFEQQLEWLTTASYSRTKDDGSMACRQCLVTFPFFRRTFLKVVVVIHFHRFHAVVPVGI